MCCLMIIVLLALAGCSGEQAETVSQDEEGAK